MIQHLHDSTNSDPNILVPGRPPLTVEIAQLLQETIEKALATNLTTSQQELFRQELIAEWRQNSLTQAALRDTITQFRAIWQQISVLPSAKQRLSWQEVGRRLYTHARQHGNQDPFGQLVIKLYEAKNQLLVKSNPPLSLQAAANYAEMSLFIHYLVLDPQTSTNVKLDPIQQHAIVSYLQTEFPRLSSASKEQISQADSLWGVLRYNWEQASTKERENFREELLALNLHSDPTPPVIDPITSPKIAKSKKKVVPTTPNNPIIPPAPLPVATTPTSPLAATLVKNHRFLAAIQTLREQASKSNLGFQSLLLGKRQP
jgi:hypothetical protein